MPTIITRGALDAKAFGFGASSSGGYSTGSSLRFRSSASAYLNRTPSTATNRKTWTWSGWVKLGALGATEVLFGAGQNATTGIDFGFQSTGTFFYSINGVGTFTTTALYRDPSAWYHVVFALDTTQATQANRSIVYINGVKYLFTSNGVVLNNNYDVNNNIVQYFAYTGVSGTPQYFDGYMAEVNFVDGQALTPSSFGAYDTNGVWQPLNYSGTYGTNGFHLTFGNTTSTTTLGYDTSGNGNNWTTNNISLTAGSTYDSMNDSPTVTSATVANYATMNPLDTGSTITLSEGNLKTTSTATNNTSRGTIGMTSGKWYWEVQVVSGGNYVVGIGTGTFSNSTSAFTAYAGGYGYLDNGNKDNNGTQVAYGGTMAAGDIIGVAFDATAGSLTFYKNNTSQGVAYTGLTNGPYFPAASCQSSVMVANFGQQPFSYTPPTGFNALNTYNLPTPTIANGAQYMAATTYTGTGATQTISDGGNNTIGTTFQPDLVWIKSRSAATSNLLYDVIRGTTNFIQTNATTANTAKATTLTAFGSTGFTLGSDASANGVNVSAATYVGWQWKGGGTGVSNTDGSITSTVSANTTAGFSVVGFTSTGANATVGHGLGVAPAMYIVKNYASGTTNWPVYHISTTAAGNTFLNATNAYAASATMWNNTAPTSTVFSVGSSPNLVSGTTIAYCWAAVSGYSAFGSYTGNGSTNGTFVYLGFRPRWILFKSTNTTENWVLLDTSRDTYNVATLDLYPNLSNAETTTVVGDILSNGFKMRNSATGGNVSGTTYIYAAFAENPFNSSRAR